MPIHPLITSQPSFTGPIYQVGDNISSDDILSPLYLSFDLNQPDERKILADYAFQSIEKTFGTFKIPGSSPSQYKIILAGKQFGHGSARSHPVIALAEAGITAIIAQSFAIGFYRTCVNEGSILPLILAKTSDVDLPPTGESVTINLDNLSMTWGEHNNIPMEPPGVTLDIHNQGGLRRCWNQAPQQ